MNDNATPRRDGTEWQRIEADARAQAVADAEAPMPLGQSVAWVECRFGRTDGLTVVHRAAEPHTHDDPRTLCGDRIPAPVLRVALTRNLILSLGRCRYCEHEYTKVQRTQGAAA